MMYTLLTRVSGWNQRLINQLIEHTKSLIDTRPDQPTIVIIEGEFDEGQIMQILGNKFDSHSIVSEAELPFKVCAA